MQRLSSVRQSTASAVQDVLRRAGDKLKALKNWVLAYSQTLGSAQNLVDASDAEDITAVAAVVHGGVGAVEGVEADDSGSTAAATAAAAAAAEDEGGGGRQQQQDEAVRSGDPSWRVPEAGFYHAHDTVIQAACRRVDHIEVEIVTKCSAELNALDLASDAATSTMLESLEEQASTWMQAAYEACSKAVLEVEAVGLRQLRAFAAQRGLWLRVMGGGDLMCVAARVQAQVHVHVTLTVCAPFRRWSGEMA